MRKIRNNKSIFNKISRALCTLFLVSTLLISNSVTLFAEGGLSIEDSTIAFYDGTNSFKYTGDNIEPIVIVTYGPSTLVLNEHYTVEYQNNKNVSTFENKAKVIVKAKEGSIYTGEKELEFVILSSAANVTSDTELETELTYKGEEQLQQLIKNPCVISNAGDIVISYGISQQENTIPTSWHSPYNDVSLMRENAGTYYVYMHISGTGVATESKLVGSVQIKPAQLIVDGNISGATGLSYTGSDIHLIKDDYYDDYDIDTLYEEDINPGTMQFAVSTNSNATFAESDWKSESSTTVKEPGSYYVWYRYVVTDNSNYIGIPKTRVGNSAIVVDKATPTITLQDKTVDYNGSPVTIDVATVTLVNSETYSGTVTYKYYTTNNSGVLSGEISAPTNAGTYWVQASIPEDNHYKKASSAPAKLVINKVNVDLTEVINAEDLKYNGSEQQLITNASTVTGGTMYFALGDNETTAPTTGFTTTIPSEKDLGKYYVWYYVVGDQNHNDTAKNNKVVCINKGIVDVPTVNNKDYIAAHVNSGLTETNDYTVEEDVGGTNPGTYSVKLKLKDNVHYAWSSDTDHQSYNSGNSTQEETISYDINEVTISVEQAANGDIEISSNNSSFINKLTEKDNDDIKVVVETINNSDPPETLHTKTLNNTALTTKLKVVDGKLVISYDDIKELYYDGANVIVNKGDKLRVTATAFGLSKAFVFNSIRGSETIDITELYPDLAGMKVYVNGQAQDLTTNKNLTINDCETILFETYGFTTKDQDNWLPDYQDYRLYTKPTSMNVYKVYQDSGVTKIDEITDYENVLTFLGTTIRLTDPIGFRIITTIPKDKRETLISSYLSGYKTIEYGTIMAWNDSLSGKEPSLTKDLSGNYIAATGCAKGYAYSLAGNMNAVLADYSTATATAYSNILTEATPGSWTGKHKSLVAMRSYMILRPQGATDASQDVVIYNGTTYRSVAYMAQVILNSDPDGITYPEGSANRILLESLAAD